MVRQVVPVICSTNGTLTTGPASKRMVAHGLNYDTLQVEAHQDHASPWHIAVGVDFHHLAKSILCVGKRS
jgi:hypothetical protein